MTQGNALPLARPLVVPATGFDPNRRGPIFLLFLGEFLTIDGETITI
jgi:hypothetical protein